MATRSWCSADPPFRSEVIRRHADKKTDGLGPSGGGVGHYFEGNTSGGPFRIASARELCLTAILGIVGRILGGRCLDPLIPVLLMSVLLPSACRWRLS
jgi:hypothetical protein